MTCGQCGILVSDEAKFCSHCGHMLVSEALTNAKPSAPWIRYAVAGACGALAYASILYRFLSYTQRNNLPPITYELFAAATFFLGFFVTLGAKHSRYRIASCVVLGACAGHALVVTADVIKDPTGHNLLPFEFVFLGANALPAYLGAALAQLAEYGFRKEKS